MAGYTGQPSCTNFEATGHDQLVKMVESANPNSLLDIAQALLRASDQMDQISSDLHAHISGLDWQGGAADNFKTWGGQVSSATMDMATYSRTAGKSMADAGEMLAGVKSGMPPVPTNDIALVKRYNGQSNGLVSAGGAILGSTLMPGGGTVLGGSYAGNVVHMFDSNWVTQDQANAAQGRINTAHQDAIQQMIKLGQSYDQSAGQMGSAQPPTFPAPPGSTNGNVGLGGEQEVPVGGGSSGGGYGGGAVGGGYTGGGTTGHGGGGNQPRFDLPSPPTPVAPGPISTMPAPPPPSTGIDSVALPPAPAVPVAGPSNPGGPGAGGGFGMGSGGGLGGGGFSGVGFTGGLPGGGFSGGQSGGGSLGGSRVPGRFTGSAGGSVGEGGASGAGRATGTGGRQGGAAGSSSPTANGQAGKPGAGSMPHLPGGGGAQGAAAGGSRGRGLTSRAGGTVGGSRGAGSGGEFTPGGSGLRGRAARGAQGANGPEGQGAFGGGHGAAGKKERERRNRASYLQEDEDTWTSGMGRANPGVIE